MSFRVVVVGAGDMGVRHAAHWRAAGAEVVAVCDPDPARAQAAAARVGATACGTLSEALQGGGVAAVSVCTPTHLHAPLTIQALEAGAHVLCEKPIALTLADAYAMRDAALASGRSLRIGFMRRFDPAYAQLLSMTRRAGRPLLAQVTIAAGIRPKRLMHDAMANGGPIVDMCCHIFNLWEKLFGAQPERVSARGYTFGDNKLELAFIEHRALDSALFTLEYPGGSVGQVQVSWGLPAGIEPVERHTYLGPDGVVNVSWNRQLTLRDARGLARWASSGADPWREEIAAFYRELTTGEPGGLATAAEGIEALRSSLAVLLSVREGRPIAPHDIVEDPPLFAAAR